MLETSALPVPQTDGREFVRSEHGALRAVALCRPTYYDWPPRTRLLNSQSLQARQSTWMPPFSNTRKWSRRSRGRG